MHQKEVKDFLGEEAQELERRLTFARQVAAQVWCSEKTSGKVFDSDLAEVFARILVGPMYETHLGCATTGELLEEIKARVDLDYSTMEA